MSVVADQKLRAVQVLRAEYGTLFDDAQFQPMSGPRPDTISASGADGPPKSSTAPEDIPAMPGWPKVSRRTDVAISKPPFASRCLSPSRAWPRRS